MTPERQAIADNTPGWLLPGEGELLNELGLKAPGPLLEIGAYCGKSTVWLGDAAEQNGNCLYSVDHHLGSPEMQPGQGNHRPELVAGHGHHDTLTLWRAAVVAAELTNSVIGIIASSGLAGARWAIPLGLVFIDADHGYAGCRADFDTWARHLRPDGLLVFHDTTIPDIRRVIEEAMRYGFRAHADIETMVVLQA